MEGSAAVGPKVVMPPLLSAIEDHLPLLLRAAVTTAGATVTVPPRNHHASSLHASKLVCQSSCVNDATTQLV